MPWRYMVSKVVEVVDTPPSLPNPASRLTCAAGTTPSQGVAAAPLGVRPVEVVPGQLREAGCRRLVAERAVGSSVVVVVEPDGERGGALLGAGVDGAVGPAGEQRADEAFGLAVGLWPVGARAQVAQAQGAAGERVGERDVGGAVVCHQALHGDPVRGVEGQRTSEEADRGCGLLV